MIVEENTKYVKETKGPGVRPGKDFCDLIEEENTDNIYKYAHPCVPAEGAPRAATETSTLTLTTPSALSSWRLERASTWPGPCS